jgi:hypothetical protein
MNIRFLEPARSELDDAFDWYEMEQSGLGRRFLAEIQSALKRITVFTETPKKTIRVGSTTMTPEVPFEIQVMRIDDAPFSQFIGRDAEIRQSGGVCEIVKFY